MYQRFRNGNIRPEEVAELRQILDNESYLSISEGDLQAGFSISSILEEIDGHIREGGIRTGINLRVSTRRERISHDYVAIPSCASTAVDFSGAGLLLDLDQGR